MDVESLIDLVAIADSGSFSGAARLRRVSVSTLSRRITALESAAGFRLLDRGARGAGLTVKGSALVDAARPLADQVGKVTRSAARLRDGLVRAPVRVSATEFVIADVLAPALPRLWSAHSDVMVQLRSEANLVSLPGHQADVAVRMSRPEGASLIQRRIATLSFGFYRARGTPLDPASARLIAYDDSFGEIPERRWLVEHGWMARAAATSGSTRAIANAVRAGAGIALLPDALACADPALERLYLPAAPSRNIWLVYHRDLRGVPEIAATCTWIASCFQDFTRGR